MRKLYWLSDAEWFRLEPLLPRGRKGAHRVDDRRVISGILHMLCCAVGRVGATARANTGHTPRSTIVSIAGAARAFGWRCLLR